MPTALENQTIGDLRQDINTIIRRVAMIPSVEYDLVHAQLELEAASRLLEEWRKRRPDYGTIGNQRNYNGEQSRYR